MAGGIEGSGFEQPASNEQQPEGRKTKKRKTKGSSG
jgi:hypothetical protein